LTSVTSTAQYKTIVKAICKRLDQLYPLFAPWSLLEQDAEKHPTRTGLTFQVYDDDGRQPVHFDNGMYFMTDHRGHKWCSTAVIVHLSDSYGTFLAGPPVDGLFRRVVQLKDHVHGVTVLNAILKDKEKTFEQPSLRRAGHMLTFNPGEQAHAGVGSGKYRCALTKLPRVTLYATGVPTRFFPMMKNMDWAGAEGNTFGLLDDVDVNRVQFFNKYKKKYRKRKKKDRRETQQKEMKNEVKYTFFFFFFFFFVS
jgi:hypothetical protein